MEEVSMISVSLFNPCRNSW